MNSTESPTWQAHDSAFFDRLDPILDEIGKKPVYSLLTANKEGRKVEKQTFLTALDAGQAYLPNLTPDFDYQQPFKSEIELLQLRETIKAFKASNEEEQAVKDAYRWKVNALIGDLRIAEAAKFGDMRAFKAYNRYLYGSPSLELFNEETEAIRADAAAWLQDPGKAEAAAEVLEVLKSVISASAETDSTVSPELFQQVKIAHQPFFDEALEGIEVPEFVQPAEGMQIVGQILHNLGVDKPPYNYKPVPYENTTASINHPSGEVRYPEDVTYNRARFIGLYAGHEIHEHIIGRINGAEHDFKLVRKSLDRSERANEGKGVIAEQVAYDSMEEFLSQERALTVGMRHLTAALAVGVDGQPRDFYQVFKIAEPIFRMYGHEDSKTAAWNLLSMRTMKGTKGAGAAYLKDSVYAEGAHAYWRLAKEHPELIPFWYDARADLTNPRHVAVLQTLGVLPRFKEVE